jgi:hypothetical protein
MRVIQIQLSYGWLVSLVAFSFLRGKALAFLPSCSTQRSFTPALSLTLTRTFKLNPLTPSNDIRTHEASSQSSKTSTSLRNGMWTQDDELKGSDRLKACVPYLLPLIDGDPFAQYMYLRIPALGAVNNFFLGPLLTISHNVPFFCVGLFVALTLGTITNTDMHRNVRFSAQQAALLHVALILPELIGSSSSSASAGEPIPRYIIEPCHNFVWYAYASAVIYCVYSNLRGKKPDQIPFLSAYSELMVGPM